MSEPSQADTVRKLEFSETRTAKDAMQTDRAKQSPPILGHAHATTDTSLAPSSSQEASALSAADGTPCISTHEMSTEEKTAST